jgi:hypothetical protein
LYRYTVDWIYDDIFASLNPKMKKLEPIAIFLMSPDKLRMDPSRPEDSGAARTAGGKPPEAGLYSVIRDLSFKTS